MAGTRAFDAARFFRRQLALTGGHHIVPVGPVFVLDHHGQRRAQRQAMSDTADDLYAVLLDLHPRAAAIALLSPMQFVIDLLDVDGQTSGQAFDYRDKRATM